MPSSMPTPAGRSPLLFERKKSGWACVLQTMCCPASTGSESTQVGLTSIETMMEKMNAVCRVEQGTEQFAITLLFPIT